MIFTKNLLLKFIPDFVKIDNQSFTNAVISLGMEIETIKMHPKNYGLVVGKIIEIERHSDNKKLSVCKVKISENEIKTIVCGANNLKKNKYCIVCLNNAKLYNGTIILNKQFGNVVSEGMLCSYQELTPFSSYLPNVFNNQIILFNKAKIGDKNWEQLIGLDDVIYDIAIPNNRNDLNSYLVFCNEVANKLGLRTNLKIKNILPKFEVINQKKEKCSSHSSLNFLFYDCKNNFKKISDWNVIGLLMNHQIRPINKLFDKLSYISLLTNCPTHVYDFDQIKNSISANYILNEKKFLALNGTTYTLTKKDICTFDGDEPITIAGIIGGNDRKFTEKTQKIIIEIGNFNYVNIRNTMLNLNISTNSGKQLSKPISNFMNLYTIYFILKYFHQPKKMKISFIPNWNMKPIEFDKSELQEFLLCKEVSWNEIKKKLRQNGFKIRKKMFFTPSWRLDLNNKQDIVEEVLKIIDINNLLPQPITDNLIPINENNKYNYYLKITNVLTNNYFNEVHTYNLTNENNLKKFNIFNLTKPIRILTNNTNRQYLRNNLIDNMLNVYRYNLSKKHELLPIYEIQTIHDQNFEFVNLTLLITKQIVIDPVSKSIINVNLNFLKAIIIEIGMIFNIILSFVQKPNSFFYDNEAMEIIHNKKTIGYIGKIKKKFLHNYDLNNQQIYVLTINIDNFISIKKQQKEFKFKPLGMYQQINKDINFSMKKNKNITIDIFCKKIMLFDEIDKYKITSVYHDKNGDIVYTIKYFLKDNRQYTTNDLENIYKKISSLIII